MVIAGAHSTKTVVLGSSHPRMLASGKGTLMLETKR